MPIHDWSRVPAGLFHHFHQDWSIEIARTLNRGRLPKGLSALVEQRSGPHESDILAIEIGLRKKPEEPDGGVATVPPPVTRIIRRSSNQAYASRANRIVVKHHLGQIVAVIEIVSPGNKDSRAAIRDFVEKTVDFLRKGVHVLDIDLFPPTAPTRMEFTRRSGMRLSRRTSRFRMAKIEFSFLTKLAVSAAYIEPVGLGDSLPEMPLFLTRDLHIMVPLEMTYQTAWNASPEELRFAVESGNLREPEEE